MSAVDGDGFLPSEDLLSEQAYLVARGVRPMALVGHCHSEPLVLLRIATEIEKHGGPAIISFVIDHENGNASFGYAASEWAVDLYEWAVKETDIPQVQRERIIGLLLGYAADAVSRYEEGTSGRRFSTATSSPGLASS